MQLRGSCLTLWDNVLPPLPETLWRSALNEVAAHLAENGGTAYPA